MANDKSGRKRQSNVSNKKREKVLALLITILIILAGTLYEVFIKEEIQETNPKVQVMIL